MIDLIIVAVLLVTVGGASAYIYNTKKKGCTCIGCPHAKTCGSNICNCQTHNKL
jgi:hypothetical protein